jgi:hypothetical protein
MPNKMVAVKPFIHDVSGATTLYRARVWLRDCLKLSINVLVQTND